MRTQQTYEYVASPADASAFSQWKKLGKSDRFALLALAGFGLTLGVGLFFNSENRVSKVYESTNNAGYVSQLDARMVSRVCVSFELASNSRPKMTQTLLSHDTFLVHKQAVQAERISSRDLKRRQPSSNSNGGEPAAGTS